MSTNNGTLGLSAIKLTSLAAFSGPAAPTGGKVVAAPMGELKATIEFTAPTKNIKGNELTSLSKVEVFRGSDLVGTVNNPTPGQPYNVTDSKALQGINKYDIVATDANDVAGLKASVEGWVGLDIPSLPENLDMIEQDNNLVLTWELPEYGTHGGYVNPAEVVYTVIDPNFLTELAYATGVTRIELPLGEMKSQSMYRLGLVTSNAAGTNPEGALTPSVVAGPAHKLPFHEHFSPKLDYSWHTVGSTLDDNSAGRPLPIKALTGRRV